METDFNKTYHKKTSFLILIFLSFSLLSFSTNSTERKPEKNNTTLEKQITIVITKKTTKEELEEIKEQMTDEGLGFKYSNVIYNDKNEIIAISIYYKDLKNNSGNYSVSSQNPINNIVIVSDGNRISVKNEGSSNQSFISQGSGETSSSDNEKTYKDHRQAMQERSEQMEREMEERMKEMKERHAAMKNRMQKRSDSISAINQSQIKSTTDFKGNSNLITKNTTDLELIQIQKSYDVENISFNYKNIQRNDENQITHISITIDNRNGSISTSGFGNGKDAIKNIIVAVDKQHTIMKNAE